MNVELPELKEIKVTFTGDELKKLCDDSDLYRSHRDVLSKYLLPWIKRKQQIIYWNMIDSLFKEKTGINLESTWHDYYDTSIINNTCPETINKLQEIGFSFNVKSKSIVLNKQAVEKFVKGNVDDE